MRTRRTAAKSDRLVALAVRIIIGDAIQVPTAKRMVFNTRAFTFVYNTDLCVCVCGKLSQKH